MLKLPLKAGFDACKRAIDIHDESWNRENSIFLKSYKEASEEAVSEIASKYRASLSGIEEEILVKWVEKTLEKMMVDIEDFAGTLDHEHNSRKAYDYASVR